MSETELQRQVMKRAKATGWTVLHMRQGGKGWALGSGFPDLLLARPGDLMFAELKAEDKDLEPKQVVWKDLLESSGQTFAVWKPSDLRLGIIESLLVRPQPLETDG